jgi:hypothetical protein
MCELQTQAVFIALNHGFSCITEGLNFADINSMKFMKLVLLSVALLPVHNVIGVAQENADIAYLWQAELMGPTQKCDIPKRIKSVVADAIIKGKISLGNKIYFPQGRLEDSRDMELSLIRFYDDKTPLLTLSAKADGTWNGIWTAKGKDCTGKVRVLPRGE